VSDAPIGFVLVDKPAGPTSHDIVARVRKILGVKRVGHAGTLDPIASGLLVLGVGPATRLLSFVQGLPKTYEATGVLGVRTTTLDAAGVVVSSCDANVAPDDIRAAAAGLVGEIEQVPPAHSAVKVGGERAYKKARRGEATELAPRRVTVYAFDVLRTTPSEFDARFECSSGTYIRSLVADVGDRLDCGAHVSALRRTAIGHLRVDAAVLPDDVSAAAVRPVEDVLTHLPRLDVDAETAQRAGNGRPLEASDAEGDTLVCGPGGAIGIFRPVDGLLRPVTVLGH
jgi:tRNA pseudouridine55 synthase